eukprot:4570172-Pleurochrysis_carterae.AAC.3
MHTADSPSAPECTTQLSFCLSAAKRLGRLSLCANSSKRHIRVFLTQTVQPGADPKPCAREDWSLCTRA